MKNLTKFSPIKWKKTTIAETLWRDKNSGIFDENTQKTYSLYVFGLPIFTIPITVSIKHKFEDKQKRIGYSDDRGKNDKGIIS